MRLIQMLCLAGLAALAGCTTARLPAPEQMFNTAALLGFDSDVRYVSMDPSAIESRFSRFIELRRAASKGAALNILALSGGGAGGSFGAGALVGFSEQGKRPQFDIVTGVSAGALIAPFAFLGSAWDARLDENFSGDHSEHFLISRGIGILFGPGVYQSKPLVEFVDHFVTGEMIREVAAQAAQGRLLLVATTDLDKEETVIWDMGKIAAHGGEAARILFRDVLVASASIPGAFAPVILPVENKGIRYDEMHVDASASVPFFVAPALAYVLPLDPYGLKGASIYIIVNGQLVEFPHTTEVNTIDILSRSLSAELNHMARAEIALTSAFAQKYGMSLRITVIPIDYPFSGPLDFHQASSRKLFDYGAECAREGRLWSTVEQAIAHSERVLATELAKNKTAPERHAMVMCPLDDSSILSILPTQPH
ncbi:MAG: patatin-like phospholipase family protein [Gallionella sp.]